MIGGLGMYLLGPPLAERGGSQAVEAVRRGLDEIGPSGAPCLAIAPAGLTTVDDDDQALEHAEAIRLTARRAGVVLLFGIDVGPPRPGAGRLFTCFGGAPVLWPSFAERSFPRDVSQRLLRLGASTVLPLFAGEALDPNAPRRVAQIEGLSAIVILSHGGATQRWRPALSRLEGYAPVIVSAHQGGVGRTYVSPSLEVHPLPRVKEEPLAA